MPRFCIGIDLGGTFIKFGLLDSSLKPSGGPLQLPTPTDRGGPGVIEQMIAGARQLMDRSGLSRRSILAVGIGSPGPIKISQGIVIALPNIPGMKNVPMRDEVAKGLGIQTVLENDANAAAYGEYICGAGSRRGDMVLLTLGTGVGSGIILGSRILHGAHEIGGEIGHMIVQPGGERCGCGQRGCLERYASATYMAGYAQRLVKGGRRSLLKAVLKTTGTITSRDVNEARKAGDSLAAEVWDRAACFLALACVNICRIFDPERIVLGGGLSNARGDILRPVLKHYRLLHWGLTRPRTEIRIAALGNDAGAIGAAGVAWATFGKQQGV